MADYPPTPMFGLTPKQNAQTYRDRSHHEAYDHGDLPKGGTSLLDYHITQTNTAAFQHNASHIPGFNVSSVASGIPPVPIYRDRSSLSYGYLQDPLPRGENFESRGGQNAHESPSTPPYHELVPDVRLHRKQNLLSHKLADKVTEEGELSEGEYEEIVAEADVDNERVFEPDQTYGRPRVGRRLSVLRTGNGQYRGSDQIPTPKAPLTDMYGRSVNLNRQRSESYSPYEPPNQAEYDQGDERYASDQRRNIAYRGHNNLPDQYNNDQSKSYRSLTPDAQMTGSALEPIRGISAGQREPDPSQSLLSNAREDPSKSLKTIEDARKAAQSAILNLVPLKVRFHDYLEAGIDKEIVLRQFDSLGMAPTSVQLPNNNLEPASQLQDVRSVSHSLVSYQGAIMEPKNLHNIEVSSEKQDRVPEDTLSEVIPFDARAPSLKSMNPSNNNNIGEERKDRIARLLAERKQKHSSPVTQPDSPITSASPEVAGFVKPATSSQTVAKADKERQIRQKMEALQKSREQRAQKAAAKSVTTLEPATANKIIVDPPRELSFTAVTAALPGTEQIQNHVPSKSSSPAQLLPSIPGLFLAAGTNNPPTTMNYESDHTSLQKTNLRKRPVASDFDEPQAVGVSYKRPFGQSRVDKPLVIDVSDEDSDNEEQNMTELEKNQQALAFRGLPQNGSGTPKQRTARDLPPLSDFPPRKVFALPASATNTPPPLQQTSSKIPVRTPEDLQKKEKEIQDMKRRIAEAERRKIARQNLSGSQTPASNHSTNSPAKSGSGVNVADKINPAEIERLIESASCQISQDQQKLAEAYVMEQRKADELKKSDVERRRLRRAKIATDLPVVEAKVENDQKKLADIKAELARIEADVEHGLIEKRRLAEEMEQLVQEGDEPITIHEDSLKEIPVGDCVEKNVSDSGNEESGVTTATPHQTVQGSTDTIQVQIGETASETPLELGFAVDAGLRGSDARSLSPFDSQIPFRPSSKSVEPPEGFSTSPMEHRVSSSEEPNILTAEGVEVTFPDALRQATAESWEPIDIDSEMADSFAPGPKSLAPALAETATMKGTPGKGIHKNEIANIAEGESDNYEPPDATPPHSNSVVSPCSSPFSPAPPEGVSEFDENLQHNALSFAANGSSVEPASQVESILRPARQTDQANDVDYKSTFYTSYESPLKNFRAYRFHPSYIQNVKGGFKSLTYSNKINADQELCRYELAGGVCNDASCEFQHFRDMELADNVILVELGNSAGYSEEETPRWIIGLRTVLQVMRAKNTNDFELIASEIIAYRATFLEDASRVLPLGGVAV